MGRKVELSDNAQDEGQSQDTQRDHSPSVTLFAGWFVGHAAYFHAGAQGLQGANRVRQRSPLNAQGLMDILAEVPAGFKLLRKYVLYATARSQSSRPKSFASDKSSGCRCTVGLIRWEPRF